MRKKSSTTIRAVTRVRMPPRPRTKEKAPQAAREARPKKLIALSGACALAGAVFIFRPAPGDDEAREEVRVLAESTAQEAPPADMQWTYPVAAGVYVVTSCFGVRTFEDETRMHQGVDLRGALDTGVVSLAAGEVIRAGSGEGYGQLVELEHAGGWHSLYAHLNKIAVRAGQRVSAGQLLGSVGMTGHTNGPHLHLEVYKYGAAIDPLSLLVCTPDAAKLRSIELCAPVRRSCP